ncbi:hypothetical protein TTHERM_001142778 (macronuclear) [Tetrahymena thermophila SB210]|uniref:Uncharacterized protein n=1 Tax=Tetrahymena thermophila (strain SB210) TaxID=312017 RepID=W7XDD0_TETTS|nr:hypothetical protein TTHERM_001142778 [Tetrahymena thermophila SB210]EWS74648.1 hypothetical protein TTHERM_001142778 [Tetrahymena thermophila SB210]|eukprot:XP_012652870.1 hypothetical protein TTHERM_001142778 [Tetrahymena thermophila SB210]
MESVSLSIYRAYFLFLCRSYKRQLNKLLFESMHDCQLHILCIKCCYFNHNFVTFRNKKKIFIIFLYIQQFFSLLYKHRSFKLLRGYFGIQSSDILNIHYRVNIYGSINSQISKIEAQTLIFNYTSFYSKQLFNSLVNNIKKENLP